MTEKIFSATNDVIFKRIFGDLKNKQVIKGFLSTILDLCKEEYDVIHIENPFLNISESANDKIGILDVKIRTKSDKIIDIEIQVARMKYMRERILYYLSKMTFEQIGSGEEYSKIQKVVSIIIASDHVLIEENDKQHNRYVFYDAKTGSTFTDKMEINTLDLMKKAKGNTSNPDLIKWVDLFNANTEEELEMILDSSDPAIKRAAEIVEYVNKNKDLRVQAEQRDNAIRAYRSEMIGSKEDGIKEGMERGIKKGMEKGIEKGIKEGMEKGMERGMEESKIKIARNAIDMGLNVEQIINLTGLTAEEIEKLK